MGIKVPVYERQVKDIVTPQVSTPHALRPPAAAFGTENSRSNAEPWRNRSEDSRVLWPGERRSARKS